MDYQATLRSYTFLEGYSNTSKVISADTLQGAKAEATRWASECSITSTFKDTNWQEDNGEHRRESDNVKSDVGHRDLIILRRAINASEEQEEQEILTPTEKLKALRQTAKVLSDALGNQVVTYDDDTTNALLDEAEGHAVTLLKTIHDDDPEEIVTAVLYHLMGENQ